MARKKPRTSRCSNEQQAAKGGTKNVGGEGAAKLTGPDATKKRFAQSFS